MTTNGNFEIDEIIIDGITYRVRRQVVDEIVSLRRGTVHEILERIRAIKPKVGDTIIVTTPAKVSGEFVQQVGALTKQNFPEHQIIVMPEGLDLHTTEGLAELMQVGTEVAMAVQECADGPVSEHAKLKAQEFIDLLTEPEADGD